jgi:carbamoylphosphate synthase large subunit
MEIKNPKTLILNLEAEADTSIEMKLIRELGVNNLEKTSVRTIRVTLDKKMQSNKDYTLTVIKLASADNKEVSMDNSTIDFKAPEFNPPVVELDAAPEEPVVTEKKELPPTGTKENIIIILSLLLG